MALTEEAGVPKMALGRTERKTLILSWNWRDKMGGEIQRET